MMDQQTRESVRKHIKKSQLSLSPHFTIAHGSFALPGHVVLSASCAPGRKSEITELHYYLSFEKSKSDGNEI